MKSFNVLLLKLNGTGHFSPGLLRQIGATKPFAATNTATTLKLWDWIYSAILLKVHWECRKCPSFSIADYEHNIKIILISCKYTGIIKL